MYNLSQKLLNWYHVPMVVRIRFGKGFRPGRKRQRNKRLALVLAALLPPTALAAAVLAIWRIAADLNWTSSFAISTGIFSHWQVWLGAAVARSEEHTSELQSLRHLVC